MRRYDYVTVGHVTIDVLSNPDLSDPDLSDADLSDADLSDPDLSDADLSDADLSDPDLSDADLSDADLSDPDLSDADLSDADLSDPDLSDADLSDADLSDADLSGAGGSRRPGGGAFYSALQASRLGLRTLILTQGDAAELEPLLAPYRAEFDVEIAPAQHTTTLATSGLGARRRQRLLAWAGPMTEPTGIDTSILHFAPVARETPSGWSGETDFLGVTPQGLVREWAPPANEIVLGALDPTLLPKAWDAVVLNRAERGSCHELTSRPRQRGVVVVTAGAQPTEIHLADGSVRRAPAPRIKELRDDLGAGDVFAAALFVALYEGRPATAAARFAGAAAALRIAGVGPCAVGERDAIAARLHSEPPG